MDKDIKNKLILAFLIFIVTIILTICSKIFLRTKYKDPYETAGYIVGSYYEDVIYENVIDKISFAKQYEESGITFNVYEVLKNYNMNYDILKNNSCEYKEATVTIYPKKPYKKEDYTYKILMKCNGK